MKPYLWLCAVALVIGCSAKPPKHCLHDGSFTTINFTNTWRVDVSDFLESDTDKLELGICKDCGRILDSKRTGDNYISHFPIENNSMYRTKAQRKADDALWNQRRAEADAWPAFKTLCATNSLAEILNAISNCPPKHWVVIGPGKWEIDRFYGDDFSIWQNMPPMIGIKGTDSNFFMVDTNGVESSSVTIGTTYNWGRQ